jgi:peptide/nickel transport system permease protein
MLKYLARRFVNYILASETLNPISRYLNTGGKHTSRAVAVANLKTYNMDPDTPVLTRYWRWLNGVFMHGNFGKVFPGGTENITTEMGRRIGVSLRLLLVGTVLAVIFGVLIGVYSALRQYKFSDHVITLISFVLLSTPVFLLAVVVKFAGIWWNTKVGSVWFPTANEYDTGNAADILSRLDHLILPTFVLVAGPAGAAYFSRYQRSAMLDVLGSDFIRTAQAKGLSKRKAFYKHGLRTALIPMATFFAYTFGLLIIGATFTELAFNWHGMGEWSVQTIENSDVNGISAVTAFIAVMVLISGMLSDIFYAILDPRVRVN